MSVHIPTVTDIEKALETREWNIVQRGPLSIIESPLLNEYAPHLVHAFTTRNGGNTVAPYDNFNLGRHVQDDALRADALANRAILCEQLGADHNLLKVPGQVHSGNVVPIVERQSNQELTSPDLSSVDGVTTNLEGVPLLLHFADCVPVIIYERKNKIVSIVHAGWRGTAQAIAVNAVKLMVRDYGADVREMVAAVGPGIGTCCYPTGEDVVEQLLSTLVSADADASKFGALVVRADGDQPRPNLKAINAMQLILAGVTDVDVSSFCTACRPDIFYSHRQSGGKTGRQGALAMLSKQGHSQSR